MELYEISDLTNKMATPLPFETIGNLVKILTVSLAFNMVRSESTSFKTGLSVSDLVMNAFSSFQSTVLILSVIFVLGIYSNGDPGKDREETMNFRLCCKFK